MASFAASEQDEIYDLNQQLEVIKKIILTPLSLKQIHSLSDEVEEILKTAFKVAKVSQKILFAQDLISDGEKLLQNLESLKQKRKREDSEKLVQLRGLDSRIDEFALMVFEKTPKENFDLLENLYREVKSFAKKNRELSYALDHAIDQSFSKISRQHLALKYPLIQELMMTSYEPNFIQKIFQVKEAFLLDRKKGTLLFMKLSKGQREGIYRAFERMKQIPNGKECFFLQNVSDFERASAVGEYIDYLTHFVDIAHTLEYVDENKAFYQLDTLDSKTQKELDDLLREIAEREGDMKKALTNTIMTYLERQILS